MKMSHVNCHTYHLLILQSITSSMWNFASEEMHLNYVYASFRPPMLIQVYLGD